MLITKFPESDSPVDLELQCIIDTVREAITAAGFAPKMANEKSRHQEMLWDNVELHLLGCKQAVAIVEDRYKPELNPNVAKEWGWMRGMGRSVLYLRESRFAHVPADWEGLIVNEFHWAQPGAAIKEAVSGWLSSLRD